MKEKLKINNPSEGGGMNETPATNIERAGRRSDPETSWRRSGTNEGRTRKESIAERDHGGGGKLKLECLRAKQNTFVTSSQVPQFEETKYLIDTDQNSEQIELDREEEKEVNSENKQILPPVVPCSRISPVTKINSSTLFAKQKNSEELAPINSEVSSKTDVDACEPLPASTEGNNKLLIIRCFPSKYPDVISVSDKTSKSAIQYKCHSKNSLVYVALYHIHHIWHYRVRLRESEQPIGRLRKTCKNAFPRTIPVSFGRLDTSRATESSL
ncbi:hypothetical protein TNCV_4983951 [Trichonephila clavipes]|nr:hypothetical protein TNCV_4983951 [Trichonephila clavipes]